MFGKLVSVAEGLLRVFVANGAYATRQIEDHTVTDDPDDTWLEQDVRGKPCICAYVYNRGAVGSSDVFAEVSVQVAGGRWFVIFVSGAIAPETYWKLPHDDQRNVVHRARLRLYVADQEDPQQVDALLSGGLF